MKSFSLQVQGDFWMRKDRFGVGNTLNNSLLSDGLKDCETSLDTCSSDEDFTCIYYTCTYTCIHVCCVYVPPQPT